jgi:hypothetical protein
MHNHTIPSTTICRHTDTYMYTYIHTNVHKYVNTCMRTCLRRCEKVWCLQDPRLSSSSTSSTMNLRLRPCRAEGEICMRRFFIRHQIRSYIHTYVHGYLHSYSQIIPKVHTVTANVRQRPVRHTYMHTSSFACTHS